MTVAHFRCSFISSNSSVVPNTLIDMKLNFIICYSRWPTRTRIINNNIRPPSSEFFHHFANFRLTLTVIIILKSHFFPNFTNFPTLRLRTFDQRLLIFFGTVHPRSSHVKYVTAFSLLERQLKATERAWGKVYIAYNHFFSAGNITLEVNLNCL